MQKCIRSYACYSEFEDEHTSEINKYLNEGWTVKHITPIIREQSKLSSYIEYILEKEN